MSDTNNKDKALRKALCSREQPRLPSNFTYRTMQQVYRAEAERRQRQSIAARWTATVFLTAAVVAGGVFIYRFVDIRAILQTMANAVTGFDTVPSIMIMMPVATALLLLFDGIMRRKHGDR